MKICESCTKKPDSKTARYCKSGILMNENKRQCKYLVPFKVSSQNCINGLKRILNGSARLNQKDQKTILQTITILKGKG